MNWLRHRLHSVHPDKLAVVWAFWVLQFIGWIAMMVVVQLNPKPFTNSLLYTIQISHWALVEAAGTAALSTWTLMQAKATAQRVESLRNEVEPDS